MIKLFYSWMPNQWVMNHYIYAQRLVRYRIFVWSSQLTLWLLLHLLRFVINDCNKCITSSLSKWQSSRSDNNKFLTHQLPPCSNCHMLDEIRTNSSDATYFVYCAFMTVLMFEQLNATCTARMRSSSGHVSVFPHMFWLLVLLFSPLFLSSVFFFLFNFRFRVYFFFKLPFSVLRFLVSSSCYFFFSNSSMADYFAVRVNCPSIALFFTHLGSLLEFVEGECLERISFFVGEDCPYTSLISS